MNKITTLSPDAYHVLIEKGTESPFSGTYTEQNKPGSYLCRLCGILLFRSEQKFSSSCGWPSFDDSFEQAILEQPDVDGRRVEIVCRRCKGHLGHVFKAEGHTKKNVRYCVNSLSLDFVEDLSVKDTGEVLVAAGCFWGVESLFQKCKGVVKTEVGYTGGKVENPTYEQICAGNTGHFEAIRILYDLEKQSYENIIKYFFEIHDFSQNDGQGPDIGSQYRSVIFYYSEEEKKVVQKIISALQATGHEVSTLILPVSVFWKAEEYHQNYYEKTQKNPYCHVYRKIF